MVRLKSTNGDLILIYKDKRRVATRVVNLMKKRKYLKKGCPTYSKYMLDTVKEKNTKEEIDVMKEFYDVFLEELSGLLPQIDK